MDVAGKGIPAGTLVIGAFMLAVFAVFAGYDTAAADGGHPALAWAIEVGALVMFGTAVWATWLRPGPRPWSYGARMIAMGSVAYAAYLALTVAGIVTAAVLLLR